MPKPTPEAIEQFKFACETRGPNIIATLTADGEIEAINNFFPQLTARSLFYPDLHEPYEWARCLTDNEIAALPPPKPFPFLK